MLRKTGCGRTLVTAGNLLCYWAGTYYCIAGGLGLGSKGTTGDILDFSTRRDRTVVSANGAASLSHSFISSADRLGLLPMATSRPTFLRSLAHS